MHPMHIDLTHSLHSL